MPGPLQEPECHLTARRAVTYLGPASSTFGHALDVLGLMYHAVKDEPEVEVRFREWQSCIPVSSGGADGDERLFLVHTYLATLARLMAFSHLRPKAAPSDKDDLVKMVTGDYFRERDIYNFVEEDFFTWYLNSKVLDDALELVSRLLDTLAANDFASGGQDVLKGLYRAMVATQGRHTSWDYSTSDGLAEYVLREELKLQDNPKLSVLDPACSTGTFLSTAVRLMGQGIAARGEDKFGTLLHILENVMGLDGDPVAVAIARTNYLLALGEVIRGPHPPVLVPIYLADATRLPETSSGAMGESAHAIVTSEAGVTFEVPDSVASDPAQLDWLFHRMAQYLHAAQFRNRLEGEEHSTEEVVGSLYAYLTSPKRAGLGLLPPLSPRAAEVLCGTARSLIKLALEGRDTIWLHILKNRPAPVYLSRRKFDLVVCNPSRLPKLTTFSYFARCADLYLRDGGRIALVMPEHVTTVEQQLRLQSFTLEGGLRLEKLLDLEGIELKLGVPGCVLVAKRA